MELLPISALQHLLYCERQCALIHVEQVWAENVFTAEGNVLHEKAHDGPDETRDGVRVVRGLAEFLTEPEVTMKLWSKKVGTELREQYPHASLTPL